MHGPWWPPADCLFQFKSISHILIEHLLCAWHCFWCWDAAVCTVSCGALFIWSLLNLPEQCLAHSRRYICWGVKWINRQCKLLLDSGWLCSLQHKGKRNCRKQTERRELLSWWVVMGALSLLFSSFSKISALGCPHLVISEKTTSSFQVSLLSFKM